MMPLAPAPVAPVPTKPKIGFSIEALVGKDLRHSQRSNSTLTGSRTSSPSDKQQQQQRPDSLSPFEAVLTPPHQGHSSSGAHHVRCDSPPRGGGGPHHPHFMDPLGPLKGIYAPEPTYGTMALGPQPMACASLAHVPQHPGFPNLSPLFLGNIGTLGHHQLHREAYPLYPWLLSRQGRFLGHRFQGPDAPAFLLQPFRKPKRIRTAFSPSQLLKLEHAFEKNHYVVGAERKHLAQTLSLTETQVKVWFQNRRTKHKRLKQEEEQSQSSPPSPKKKAPSADDGFVPDFETSATL